MAYNGIRPNGKCKYVPGRQSNKTVPKIARVFFGLPDPGGIDLLDRRQRPDPTAFSGHPIQSSPDGLCRGSHEGRPLRSRPGRRGQPSESGTELLDRVRKKPDGSDALDVELRHFNLTMVQPFRQAACLGETGGRI